MIKITYSERFGKSLRKLSSIERAKVQKTIDLLRVNPEHPSLRVKKLKGKKNRWECMVNRDIRIIWKWEGENIIFTIDVGHHDILRRYGILV